MTDIIPEKEKSAIPWFLKAILWLVVSILCGLLGFLVSFPIQTILLSLQITIGDMTATQAAISGIIGATIGVVMTKILSFIYSRLRKS